MTEPYDDGSQHSLSMHGLIMCSLITKRLVLGGCLLYRALCLLAPLPLILLSLRLALALGLFAGRLVRALSRLIMLVSDLRGFCLLLLGLVCLVFLFPGLIFQGLNLIGLAFRSNS